MELCIRPGQPEELAALIELQNLAIEALCCLDYNSKQIVAIVEEQVRARQARDEHWFVAEVEGQMVGFSAIAKHQPEIGGVYVHPAWTRRGVGAQLIAALEQQAQTQHFGTLTVLSSLTAIAFYTKQGYRQRHRSGFWTNQHIWIPCVLLEKQLVPTTANPRSQAQGCFWWLLLLFGLGGLALVHIHPSRSPAPPRPTSAMIDAGV